MNLSIEPYKLFKFKDIKDGLKSNLKGKLTWKGYVKNTKPCSKFGYNKFDYIIQIPILGIIFMIVINVLLIIIVYPSVFIQQILEKKNEST